MKYVLATRDLSVATTPDGQLAVRDARYGLIHMMNSSAYTLLQCFTEPATIDEAIVRSDGAYASSPVMKADVEACVTRFKQALLLADA